MKRTIYALVSALALLGSAPPVKADSVLKCIIESNADCDRRFPPSDYYLIAIRGWCYVIGAGICKALAT